MTKTQPASALERLIEQAASAHDSGDAMRFSQAACNVGNALARMQPTSDELDALTCRFLTWRLPENFNPDNGISFTKTFNEGTAHPMKHEPEGTNLFDYAQAREMIAYLLLPTP